MKDIRDPQKMGERLLKGIASRRRRRSTNVSASKTFDAMEARGQFDDVPVFDDGNPGPLERYGDPRELHKRRVAGGKEPRA